MHWGGQRLREFRGALVGQGVTTGGIWRGLWVRVLQGVSGDGTAPGCAGAGRGVALQWLRPACHRGSKASVPLSPPSWWPLGAARPSSAGPAAPDAAAALPRAPRLPPTVLGVGEGRSLASHSPPLLWAWVKGGVEEAGSSFSRYRKPRLADHRAVKSSDPFTKEVERLVGVRRRTPSFPRATAWPCRPEPVTSGRQRT